HLRRAIDETLDMMSAQIRESQIEAAVEFSAPSDLQIVADPTRLRQILLNLLGNAIKFAKGGRILIACRVVNGHSVQIEVHDDGRGIAKDLQEKVFEPFVQQDQSFSRQYGGVGLGLYLSRNIATAMGGSLRLIEPRFGKGASFLL